MTETWFDTDWDGVKGSRVSARMDVRDEFGVWSA